MATVSKTFSVKNGIDVANTIIVDSTRNVSNINTASFATVNAATVNANTFITTEGLNVTDQANAARLQANTARDQANTARDVANGAYGQANGAYGQANGAYSSANGAYAQANGAYAQANGAYEQANGAYGQANVSANTVRVYANGAGGLSNKFLNFNNTSSVLVTVTDSGDGNANIAFTTGGASVGDAYAQANAARQQANAAYDAANNNQVTVVANNGLAINGSDVMTTIYDTTISDSVSSVVVGGAAVANAAVWRTKNIVQVLDAILFPDLDPTYTVPTITISATITGTREIGETINQALTSVGTKNDANTFTQIAFRRGSTTINTNTSLVTAGTTNVANQYGYVNPNNPNQTYTGTNTDVYVVTAGSTSWLARGSYGAGVAKKNNKGVDDTRTPAVRTTTAPQAACTTFDSSTTSITGIYPYFWGVSSTQPTAASIAADIAAGTTNKVLADATGTVTVTFNASSQYVWLAHIGTATSKTKWYNTALNNGDIGAGQFILAPVNQNVNSPQSYWTGVSFKVYISGFATTTSGSIEFRNS